ncbi:hypothetical protein [Candidatus Burkholderia verschuerenii]|uniref:hypothetical protein n=1 Tax=Candidatus Burkholderia verschuerenii TaxID=242163 RepID=UPI0012EE4763|nr:hypothetical protein [Candidatus Burkholderia verschuerenii]
MPGAPIVSRRENKPPTISFYGTFLASSVVSIIAVYAGDCVRAIGLQEVPRRLPFRSFGVARLEVQRTGLRRADESGRQKENMAEAGTISSAQTRLRHCSCASMNIIRFRAHRRARD